jgi:hypothetical protein
MRNSRKYLGIFLLLTQQIHSEDISGKSYLSSQPFTLLATDLTYSTIFDQHFENGSVLNKPEIQLSIFGGKSTNPTGMQKYFLFNNLTSLKINEAPANDTTSVQDVVGYNFNLATLNGNFSSVITLNPEQTFAGFGISGRYEFQEKWWVTVEIPFLHVKNDLGLTEAILTTGGGLSEGLGFDGLPTTITNMTDAFKQSDMLYGKIDGPRSKKGLSDIQIMLGYDFADRTTNYFAPFIGVVLPTSNKPGAEYIWEPMLGNNKHAGIILGAYGHSHMYEKNDAHVWFTWSTKNQYLFENTQKRSFDLKRGPWTRYLAMYANDAKRTSAVETLGSDGIKTFGINLMTQDVHVSPGASNFSVMNLSLIKNAFNGTLGVTTFIRESEDIRFVNQWVMGPEVADLGTNNATNVLRSIGTMDLTDGVISGGHQIQYDDIDLTSATNTNIFVNSVYATLGYYNNADHPQLYEVGGSYETSKQNNAIDRFTVWGKFQVTF